MAWVIPRQTDYSLRRGDRGIAVWALQNQCVRYGINVVPDGDYGRRTEDAVAELQRKLRVTIDAEAGPQTQHALCRSQCRRERDLPKELLWSKCSYESAGYLGAVNWSVPGGVDCGVTQRRVYEANYRDDAVIQRAFDSGYQIPLSARTLRSRFSQWINDPGIRGNDQLGWRTAVLNHNYPALAIRIAQGGIRGLTPYYRTPQSWVTTHGVKFPDGTPVRTPLEWGQRYSLGAPDHREPGQAVKLVEDWTV